MSGAMKFKLGCRWVEQGIGKRWLNRNEIMTCNGIVTGVNASF